MLIEILFFILLCKLWVDTTKGKCKSKKRLDNKTVLITGANRGIGLETARELAKRGARIIIASRNVQLSETVRQEILNETNNTNVIVKKLDVSSLKSVRVFAADILNTETKIDILIHNAGIMPSSKITDDNLNVTCATNLYGPFLLTILLIDLLKAAPAARIIFVSSLIALIQNYDFSKLDSNGCLPNMATLATYQMTKYGEILLAHELANRLKSSKITVNSCHPGLIITELFDTCKWVKAILQMLWFLTKTPEEGAQCILHTAIDPVGDEVSGKYFIDCRAFSVLTGVQHQRSAHALWEKCEQIVRFGSNDPKL